MLVWRHWFVDVFLATFSLALLPLLFRWTRDLEPQYRAAARIAIAAAFAIILLTALMSPQRIAAYFPNDIYVLVRAMGIVASALTVYTTVVVFVLRSLPATDLKRRRAIKNVGVAVVAAPFVVAATAYVKRFDLRIVESDLPVEGLPKDLQGLRIVQLSDIHLSPLVSEAFLARAVDMANETRASLAIITGDLVTRGGDPLDACLKQLARLRSDAGTFGCLGNHEIYARAESYTARTGQRLGIRFLRHEAQPLRFGDATLNLAGVDYQRRTEPYLVGADSLIVPGATNVLLSHNPDVFPTAVQQKFDAILSGHTHGGQINFELIHPNFNVARFYTPYVSGLYRIAGSSLYVTRGIGTIGVPARIGAPPEVTVLRLCAI